MASDKRAKGTGEMAHRGETPLQLSDLLRALPLKHFLVTDTEGAVLITSDDTSINHQLQALAVTFASTNDHAGKLGMGRNTYIASEYSKTAPRNNTPTPTCPHVHCI